LPSKKTFFRRLLGSKCATRAMREWFF